MTDERLATAAVVDALAQMSFAMLDILNRSCAEHDLSVTQLRLLGILRDRTPSMAELAGFLHLDRSSVSGLIDRAERRGLVTRRTSADDARVSIVELTPNGVALGRQLAATVDARVEQLIAGVSATERARLVRLARTMLNADVDGSR
jgi:DNA-binding MarR family transcriptional regulator